MKKLVLIHGRSQQNKDSVALKREWIEAFAEGLLKSGLELPIPEDAIRFPYYGDTLAQLVGGVSPDKAADVIVRGEEENAEEKEFQISILREVEVSAKVQIEQEIGGKLPGGGGPIERGVLNWGWVRAILSGIDQHLPFGSGASIALFTKDVYQYLKNPGVRDRIEEGVREAMTQEPTVVVGHSLGSIVAYNLLRREAKANGWKIPLLVTIGCPLGINAIRDWLMPNRHPEGVGHWFNAMDSKDIVALHPLDAAHEWKIDPAVENKTDVKNNSENHHRLAGYLGDAVVARRIYDALVAGE